MKTILFIDGRNFIEKINLILKLKGKNIDFSIYNFKGLIDKVLTGINVDRKIFYLGKLTECSETIKKSKELILRQRKLKSHLEKQGFEVIFAGRVRGNLEKCIKGHETLVFREKGVDVRIAVDMVTLACDKELQTAIIGSSDSDIQPAIKKLNERKIEMIYLGFENNPNKGLAYTTNRTILIRDSEVIEFIGLTLI
ncbi:NYN domain-containing protein [Patescibacteria group bacterium]|nr:NYN domain-containing protein [Patescibacteria group bacterium]MBU1876813.1 NYN domain-containing protein [Patescibacteria group bacterium]